MSKNCRCVGKKVRDVTLKEELEVLRGEPIEVFDGNPMDIPCIETSDPDKLCKHPVVSVQMCASNHEPYIRQAIEGVMMQKTDFEFELVIGEDASQDKTREICFDYQKKYPNTIRVLWWHENVSKLGGNSRRVQAHCRGEFIAFCEGDDYWIDPLKLQKQVDVMRKHPAAGMCFTDGVVLDQDIGATSDWDRKKEVQYGLMSGRQFLFYNIFSHSPDQHLLCESHLLTATVLYRVATRDNADKNYGILKWRLQLGDVPLWLALASVADIYGLGEKTVVYRQHHGGACTRLGPLLWRDNLLSRMYFLRHFFSLEYADLPIAFKRDWCSTNFNIFASEPFLRRVLRVIKILRCSLLRESFFGTVKAGYVIELYRRFCSQVENSRYSIGRSARLHFYIELVKSFTPDILIRMCRQFRMGWPWMKRTLYTERMFV